MTDEPTHTASKEIMAPELMFSSERAPQAIKYCFERAVAITLHFQLCSAQYTVLQVKNSVRIASPVTMENKDNSHLQGSHAAITLPRIDTLGCQQKEMGHKGGLR